jgi:signal peptidase I
MAELTGTLTSVEFIPLARFLSSLRKSGDLLVARGAWSAQVSFDHGRIIGAVVDHDQGMPALEFVALVMGDGEFEFCEGAPSLPPNKDIPSDPWPHLQKLVDSDPAWVKRLPSPTAVPRLIEQPSELDESKVVMGRVALYVLLDIDGYLTVRAIVGRHGLKRSLQALSELSDLGLITYADDGSGPDQSAEELPQRRTASREQQPARAPSRARTLAPSSTLTQRVSERLMAWRSSNGANQALTLGADLAQAVVVAGILVLITRSLVQNFRVEGTSMEPSFAGGQVLVVNRAAYFHVDQTPLGRLLPTARQGSTNYLFGGPQRGDVVIFKAPPQPDADYIKRVIGLPGDTVLVTQGRVYINDTLLEEPYIRFPATYTFPSDGKPGVVPDGHYFVLGDNRPESFDSHLGWFVPVENLIGRAWLRYWPPQTWSIVQPGEGAPNARLAARSTTPP